MMGGIQMWNGHLALLLLAHVMGLAVICAFYTAGLAPSGKRGKMAAEFRETGVYPQSGRDGPAGFGVTFDHRPPDGASSINSGEDGAGAAPDEDTQGGGPRGTAGAGGSRPKRGGRRGIAVICGLAVLAALAAGLYAGSRAGKDGSVDIAETAGAVLYLEMYDSADRFLGTASGFLVNDRHTLVTNYHVVQDAYRITLTSADGMRSADAEEILLYDADADLAVLNCASSAPAEPLELGDSDSVRQGDPIYVVGYPLGVANTLSNGIVSSRYIDGNENDIIQVTAAISAGNSGGPLLDKDGRVVGVVCAYYTDGQNLNITIASNTLKGLLEKADQPTALKDWKDRPLILEESVDDLPTDSDDGPAPARPENGETGDPGPEDTVFQPMNPDWTEDMRAGVDPRFHGTWDYYMVDDFTEQNEIELAGESSCSIDLNHGIMAVLSDGQLNNRQYFSVTDQENTICQYYENEYSSTVTTYVLVSDDTIQATYVLTRKGDGSESVQYMIYEKVSSQSYDSGAYLY